MARFDVYRLRGGGLVLDCQADVLASLRTRFVIPLLPVAEAPRPAERLNPVFELEGTSHVLVTQFAATVRTAEMSAPVASLKSEEIRISNALDMLLTGY